MNSNDDNNLDDGRNPNNNRSNDFNQRTKHSPYFSTGASNEVSQISSPATKNESLNREAVNWEATAALLGGSARSPGVAGMSKSSASHNMMMEDDDDDMQTKLPSKAQHPDVQLIPGVESNRPLPPMQRSRQLNQQQLHHHPDLPFLVTNWIAHYNALQSNNSAISSIDHGLFGNKNNELPSNKTREQKAKEDEARRRIQRAAADLAWSFQTLGAFGTTNTNPSSLLSRPATYSDMARKFAPLLATSTTTDSGQNENQSVALLDSLVASSSSTTAEATKNVLENRMPRSFLEAAHEGTVPVEGSCLVDDNISSLTGTNQNRNNDESTAQGRRVGESTLSSMDANASLEYLVPTNESSGSAMQNPVLLNSNINGLTAVNTRNTAVQAGEASRKYITLRNKAIEQQKEIVSAREALAAAVTRAENSGPLSSVAARRSANSPTKQPEFDTESDLDHHRVVAQLQRRVAELNLNFSVTRGDVLDAKRKADTAWAEVVSLQNRYHDPCQQNGISSTVNTSLRKMGIRSLLHGTRNSILPKEISQEYFGYKTQSLQLENELSLLKSRLSHAITMSCHLIYPVYCLRFDKTGKYFITGADDQIVKVFHLGAGPKKAQDGEEMTFSYGANVRGAVLVCTLRGHAGVVADIDVSSDNSLLATASGDGDVRIWGLRDGCPVAILRGHRDGANMVSWSTLSPFRLVTCGENGLARMWDVRKAALKRYGDMIGNRSDYVLPTQNKNKSSSDQQSSEDDSTSNGDELRQNVPPLPQRSENVEANGNNLVIPPLPPAAGGIGPIGNAGNAANENRVNVGDFVAGDAIDEGVELIAQLQHGNLVNDSQLQGAGTRARRKAVKVMCIARCPIGGHFATGSDDGLGRVWADEDDKRVEFLDREHREGNRKLRNNDPLFIRSLTGRQQAVLGSSTAPSKERLLATLSGHNNPITDMMYSNAGDRILTASQKDGVVRLWSWSKENTIIIDGQASNASISDFQSGARQTKFSNLSQVMIRLTPVTRGESTSSNAARRKAPSSSVSQSVNCDGVTWTCDDMKVVTSQSSPLKAASTEITPGSQMIYVWDSHTGKCLMGISSSHTSMCSVLVPHPKLQSIIVSAGADGQVNVWDLERGHRFYTHSNKLMHGPISETSSRGKHCGYLEGQFSSDGLTLVLTDENGRVSIFDTLAAADDIQNKNVPTLPLWMAEQYFANDYYDLFYDSNGYCIERGSEQPPHLAPKGARCTHEGVSYSDEVRITYADIEGPSPLPEDVVRWHRDDIRTQSLSIRREGGVLAQSSHKKATVMVESPGLLSGCKTTAIINNDGKIVNLDRKESSSRKDTKNQFGSRNSNSSRSPRLSSRYRWVDFNDLSDEEIDLEDADDEDFQLSSGRRTSRQNNLQNESSEEEEFGDVEILDDSPQRRRQTNNGQRRDRRQNRRRDRSVLFEESNEPVRASSRAVSRRTYEEMDSDDEQLHEVMSTHTKPSGEYYEDWTVSQHFFKMPRGEGAGIHRKWASRTSRSEKTWWKKMYCPQVGDSVVYIPRAHYDTMQKFPIASYVGPWKSWPQYSPWPVVCCRVIHIRYRFPYEMYHRSRRKDEKLEGVAAVLTLEITGVPSQSNDRNCPWPSPNFVAPIATRTRSHELTSTFEVTVFENVPTEFIMPQFLYTWKIRALESAIEENDGIVGGITVSLQCVPEQNESGRVIEDLNHEVYSGTLTDMNWQDEREFHFECSGYNALSLQWDLEDGTQEVIPACPWDITVDHTEPPQVPSLSKETKTQLLSSLKEVMEMDEKIREWFYLHVDTTHYTDYLDMIEVPMYISLIQSRLRNNYYTNKYSVLSDVELIKDNCYKYNEDNNEFYDAACQMYEKFKTLVDAIETPEEELTTNSTLVQESRTRNRAVPTSPRRPNNAEASKRSTLTRDSNHRSQIDETESSSRSRSTRRSTRNQPVISGNQSEEEEEVNDIDEDDYAEEVSNRRVSPRRSTRGQSKEPSSSESEEEVDEIDEDEYNEDVSPAPRTTRRSSRGKSKMSNTEESDDMEVDESEEEIPSRRTSPRRSTRGKPKESSSSESEVEEEDAYESEEEVSPRRTSSRRSTRRVQKKPSSSESEEEVDEVEQEEYEEEASPRRSTRRKTSDFKAERVEPKAKTTSRRSNARANVEKEPESPSRKSSRTRATKPSYVEKNSDDEEWADDGKFEDTDDDDDGDDDVSSDEEVRCKRQKRNSRGAPAAKKSRTGYNYYPDLAKWPPVSRRKINRLGTAVIQKVRKLDTWEMFAAPVCEAFPEVADDYKAIVTEPMDLRTIEEERLPTYGRIDELQEDLILTLKNCCVFNGEGSDYYGYAVEIWHSLNDVFKEACEEEGVMLPPRFV